MKTRLSSIAILVLLLAVLLMRNDKRIIDTLLSVVNPIKQYYTNFTQGLKDKSHSFIYQKESIERLGRENRLLHQKLLEQQHYLEQIKDIYTVLPQMSKLPIPNISISETISYVKLNSFSQIILTKPKDLEEDKLYGLIQNNVVAGIAEIRHNQLYGYLTSDEHCRFSVFIGKEYAPGIATGVKNHEMVVKFIPKWNKIKKGDKVYTSGLDKIFFINLPVGVVTDIEVQSAYKIAHIKTYSDIYHPKTFFLINDPRATLVEGFDRNETQLKPFKAVSMLYTKGSTSKINLNMASSLTTGMVQHLNQSISNISSIPSRIDQTQEIIIDPEEILEETVSVKPRRSVKTQRRVTQKRVTRTNKHRRVKRVQRRRVIRKKKVKKTTLDFF